MSGGYRVHVYLAPDGTREKWRAEVQTPDEVPTWEAYGGTPLKAVTRLAEKLAEREASS